LDGSGGWLCTSVQTGSKHAFAAVFLMALRVSFGVDFVNLVDDYPGSSTSNTMDALHQPL